MKSEQAVTIDAEVVRRQALNEATNPRVTILGEATQLLNPITGQPYLSYPSGVPNPNWDLSARLHPICKEDRFINSDFYIPTKDLPVCYTSIESILDYRLFLTNKKREKPTSTEFLRYQRALAQMDVRDGKMAEGEYILDNGAINETVKRMNEANIPLDVITDARGLDVAIKRVEAERIDGAVEDRLGFYITSLQESYTIGMGEKEGIMIFHKHENNFEKCPVNRWKDERERRTYFPIERKRNN